MKISLKDEFALGIGSIILILFLIAFYIVQYNRQVTQLSQFQTPSNSSGTVSDVKLTSQEILKHSKTDDCWVIIEQKVYDVSTFLSRHPGGAGFILPYCGADATAPFLSKGGRGFHSQTAYKILGILYLGDYNSTITNQPNTQSIKNLRIDDD